MRRCGRPRACSWTGSLLPRSSEHRRPGRAAVLAAHLPPPRDELVALMRDTHERGAGIVGLCLGAFPLASSGLLDGRTAVTHWTETARLADRYSTVQVQPAALYIDHGDVLTSAGTASALDACLHVVRSRLGSAAASSVARQLVIAPHRDGDQAQYVQRPLADLTGRPGPVGATLDGLWPTSTARCPSRNWRSRPA